MKRLIIAIAFSAFGLLSIAQVPGYMGKKHQFIYTPAIGIFSPQYSAYGDLLGIFKLSHNVKYEYVIKKNMMLGVFYDLHNANLKIEQFTPVYDRVYATYHRHMIGISIKKYTSRYALAPLGAYFKYQAGVMRYTAEHYNRTVQGSYYVQDFKKTGWDLVAGVGFGKQFILGRYIPIDVGIDFNIPIHSIANAFDGFNDYITDAAFKQNVSTHMVRLNLGIGLLAF